MPKIEKARVFMSGRSQAVRLPLEFRFPTPEVYIRRDPRTGDVILSQSPGDWDQIFASLDSAGFPDDFLEIRDQDLPQVRDTL
ncbi:MAG: hypothetical protein EBY17_07215 [Acidobacteriia bacterium]|jgi:antitoxin VapB|nr:hypothetical protein [Terriglobia bacterium]